MGNGCGQRSEARRGRAPDLALVGLAALLTAASASASTWCGENGVIRFSFAPGDSVQETLVTGEPQDGPVIVEVAAWLTEVAPVARDGDAFLRLGGAELKLAITGADAQVISQEFPDPRALNVGPTPGHLAVGFNPGLRLRDGRTLLARWKVLFQGRPQDVRFGLDPGGVKSCGTMAGCPGSGTPALYAGADSANQTDCLFGAGYVPAWLNPTGEPDRTPVHGTTSYADIGVFKAR